MYIDLDLGSFFVVIRRFGTPSNTLTMLSIVLLTVKHIALDEAIMPGRKGRVCQTFGTSISM